MKLADRLSVTVTAVTAIALSVSFAVVGFLVHRDELKELDDALLSQAHAAVELARLVGPGSVVLEGAGEVPEQLTPTKPHVAVYGEDGELRAQSPSFAGRAPRTQPPLSYSDTPPAASDVELPDQTLRAVVVPLGQQGRQLLYALPRRPFDEDMKYMYRIFAVLLLAATAMVNLVARWLGWRLAADVHAIGAVARTVAEGKLDARVGSAAEGTDETRRLALDLDRMIGRLDELVRAQQSFVANAAHELRSPLATLRGEVQLALRRERDPEDYRRALREILEEVELLTTLVDDLLSLARVQRTVAPSRTARLSEVVDEAIRSARGLAEGRDVRVRAEAIPEDPLVRGGRSDLSRALRNLIENAVAHSAAGSDVSLDVSVVDDVVRVGVTDRGPGVPPRDVAHVFTPFYRGATERSGEGSGAGLGLTIARELARSYGGEVSLDELHAPGARFVLELRRADDAPRPLRA